MMSKIPMNSEKVTKEYSDKEILRVGIMAELDAINLYEQMATAAKDMTIRKILLDIATEEKTHVGEFMALLLKSDTEQKKELDEGKKEVDEKSKKK